MLNFSSILQKAIYFELVNWFISPPSPLFSNDVWFLLDGEIRINFLQCRRRFQGFCSVVFKEWNLFGKFIWKKATAVLYFRWETLFLDSTKKSLSFSIYNLVWGNFFFKRFRSKRKDSICEGTVLSTNVHCTSPHL